MASAGQRRVPILLWPFWALWRLLSLLLAATGRLLGAVLGVVLMAIGLAVSATLLGAPLGIPLAVLGLLLLVRSVL